MKVSFSLSIAAVTAILMLSGCSTPEMVSPKVPIIIDNDQTLDRVHIRDDSAEFYLNTRGGAAVRQEEVAQVLWNEHYEAKFLPKTGNEQSDQKKGAEQSEVKANVVAAPITKAKKTDDKSVYKNDRSVYSKDKSIYSKNKDKSVYAKDKSVYSADKKANAHPKDKSVYTK